MSALRVLLLAVDLATRQRDEAGQALLRVRLTFGNAREQMEQLESYAADTDARWAASSQRACSVEIMRHYGQFMDRLQQAIGLQRHVVADLEREVGAAAQALLNTEIRIASLNRLLERKQSGLRKLQAWREQKQLDEFAAMQQRRLPADPDPLGAP